MLCNILLNSLQFYSTFFKATTQNIDKVYQTIMISNILLLKF